MNSSETGLTKIRRTKRAQDDAWIAGFLEKAAMGVIATCVADQPFVVTRNYVFDADRHCLYFHGAMKGRTFENLNTNPKVCFSVSEMGRLLPDETAIEFGVEYAGVVVFGQATLVTDPEEATYGLQLLLDKYFPHLKPGSDYAPIDPAGLKVTAVFKIEIESWSGKAELAKPDYPGAFFYPDSDPIFPKAAG